MDFSIGDIVEFKVDCHNFKNDQNALAEAGTVAEIIFFFCDGDFTIEFDRFSLKNIEIGGHFSHSIQIDMCASVGRQVLTIVGKGEEFCRIPFTLTLECANTELAGTYELVCTDWSGWLDSCNRFSIQSQCFGRWDNHQGHPYWAKEGCTESERVLLYAWEDYDEHVCGWRLQGPSSSAYAQVNTSRITMPPHEFPSSAWVASDGEHLSLEIIAKGPYDGARRFVTGGGHQVSYCGMIYPPHRWGITIAQVKAFLEEARSHPQWSADMSVRQLDKKIIRDLHRQGPGVALSYNPDGCDIQHLCSHSWDENAERFLEDVVHHCGIEEDVGLFICFLCNYQGDDEEIDLQVKQGPQNTPVEKGCFAKVLGHVKFKLGGIYVIPNEELASNGEGLYSRLWCTWEVENGIRNGLPIMIRPKNRATELHLFGLHGADGFHSYNGRCGPPGAAMGSDERGIRDIISRTTGWDKIDETLKGVLWFCEHRSFA